MSFYFESVKSMEQMGADDNYIQGWIAGYLGNPEIEEQRMTDEYESGYEDGKEKTDANFSNFC
ncbi:MAG: hypothetical protein HN828_00105 [Candidatus Thioglobus sp.]|mgnify:CR=1 FL=1|jgi:hypothetical protein|uniref:Alvin_2107 family globule sulfur oxidation protein n=1 Tax=Candidatus Thioglobus sp. TaxID=2026721 RepID=UPI001D9DB570|nr:hypothetical protein [Candidatus Thioglobus sp.]MBT3186518.1 hypothetical protein [Candidatus Thioglobus sp.]MBT3431428.1 hypothetical protein [Candidatus Thioglobus sp.]MBT3965435.1 hypothetical protein [Candidatus Thioglobus sp.]MBT4316429.1 hypothetical protein [Candidatus Thioglobus sp.]MBT4553129.1 hypothetical protein [Candidatus Thioglobus sp.]